MSTCCVRECMSGNHVPSRLVAVGKGGTALKGLNIITQGKLARRRWASAALGKQAPYHLAHTPKGLDK